MSKKVKKLLEENTIRKFMKYANIETLAENFLDTVEEDDAFADEEEVEVDMGEEPALDAEPEFAPEPDVDEEMVQRIVVAVADAIEQETGVSVDVEGGAEPEPEVEEEPALDAEPEFAPEPEVEEEPTEMAEAAEDDVEEGKKYNREDDLEESEEFDYESVVSEVARRVALRLVKESKK